MGGGSTSQEGSRDRSFRLHDSHQVLHQLQRLARDMDFLRGVDRVLAPALPGILLRPALGAVHDELGLAPELSKNGPCAGLLPYDNAPPESAGGLIVTSDLPFFARLPPEEQSRFFEESRDFLARFVERENVISAMIHRDEKTPHMYFLHVPVTPDGRLRKNYEELEKRKVDADEETHQLKSSLPSRTKSRASSSSLLSNRKRHAARKWNDRIASLHASLLPPAKTMGLPSLFANRHSPDLAQGPRYSPLCYILNTTVDYHR